MIVYFINQSNVNEIIFDDFYILSSESLERTNMSGLPISLIRVFPGEADIRNHFRHIWIGQWLSVMRMSDSRKRLSRTSRTPKRPRPNTYIQPHSISNSSGIIITWSLFWFQLWGQTSIRTQFSNRAYCENQATYGEYHEMRKACESMWKMIFSRDSIFIIFWNAPKSKNLIFGSFFVPIWRCFDSGEFQKIMKMLSRV